MKEKVVIIIPTYNEADLIRETIVQVFQAVDLVFDYDVHILIFDSASLDTTYNQVRALQTQFPKLHLQTEPQKSGLGSAYMQAMRFALEHLKADIIFEFDADLSHQPHYIPSMLALMKDKDVIIGSRYVKGGSIPADWGFKRKSFSIIGNFISRLVLTTKYKDFTSGFRATRASLLAKVLPIQFLSKDYAYKLQLLWLLHKARAKIYEYPIKFIDRTQGKSKLPKSTIRNSLGVIFKLRYFELKRYFKMCMVGFIGTGIQFLLYNILRLHFTPLHASQIAITGALVNNYIWHDKFTFKSSKTSSTLKNLNFFRILNFIAYSCIMIWLQSTWLSWTTNFFGKGIFKENLLLAIGIALGSLLNYLTYTRHIWPDSKLAN